jgi:hypothetical protein
MSPREEQTAERLLPSEFADLEPLAATWGLSTEQARQARRVTSELDAVRAFYETMLPRMPAVFAYFDRIPHGDLDRLSPDQRRLYQLAAAFYEASHPIEMNWRRSDIDDAFPLDRLGFLPPSSQR